MGSNNIIYNEVTPETHYPLSSAQLNALKAGELQIAILQNGSTYSLYALDGNVFEFVESFTCKNGAASVSAIDLVVNNALEALQRSGDHEFGVKDMTVYGDHSTSMDAEEVIDFFLERDVAVNATATAGEGVTINGLQNSYMPGETVEFSLTTEKFYEVERVTVNDVEVTESNGKYSYTLPADATSVNIEVTTTQTAVVYEGKDLSANFSAQEEEVTSKGGVFGYDANRPNIENAVITFAISAPDIGNIGANSVKFGIRIYTLRTDNSAEPVADVVIGRHNGNWYVDVGLDFRSDWEQKYQLTTEQVNDVAKGAFTLAVVKEGQTYRVYALSKDTYEYVDSFTAKSTNVNLRTIDLLCYNYIDQTQIVTSGEFGVKEMTVYSGYSGYTGAQSDSELLAFLVDGKIGYRASVSAGEGVTVNGLKNSYMPGETVEFSLTTEKFYEVERVTVNDVEVTESNGKYSYTLPADATSVNIEVTTTQTAVVYEGKDLSANFSAQEEEVTSKGGVFGYDANRPNIENAVITFAISAPDIGNIGANSVKFGIRIYTLRTDNSAEPVADVVIGRHNGNWYVDVGLDFRSDWEQKYQLTTEQVNDVAKGAFTLAVVKEGQTYRVYALSKDTYEYVDSFTAKSTNVNLRTIDLLCYNYIDQTQIVTSGEFGVKEMTVYSGYSGYTGAQSDSELLAFLVDGKIGYREYAGKGDIQKNFSDIKSETDQRQGQLYSCGDHNNSLSRVTVTSASLYLEDPSGITENGTRFGLRIYNRIGNATNNNLVADIVIARQEDGWRLDIGYGIAIDNNQPSTAYTLSDAQLTALANGSLKIFIVQRGSTYTLYALDGKTLEKVEAYTDNKNGTSVSAIDFVVNTGALALKRSGDRDCAVKGTTVYGNFDETLSDEELVELFAGSNAE